jgi:hypothetical protein
LPAAAGSAAEIASAAFHIPQVFNSYHFYMRFSCIFIL